MHKRRHIIFSRQLGVFLCILQAASGGATSGYLPPNRVMQNAASTYSPSSLSTHSTSLAELQAQYDQLLAQVQTLMGRQDELHNAIKQIESYLKTLNTDIDARFKSLDKGYPSLGEMGEKHTKPSKEHAVSEPFPDVPETPDLIGQGPLYGAPHEGQGLPDGEAQRKYALAQQLFQERNFLGAEAALKDLIKNHPGDPLSVNARYWLAEISYVKQDYAAAAVQFGEAFETYQRLIKAGGVPPAASKAPEILLKMALSLKHLGKVDDARVTLAQIKQAFPHMTADIKRQVDSLSQELR